MKTSTGMLWRVLALVILLSAAACPLPAETSEEQAWSIVQGAAAEKSWEKRAKVVFVLGLIPDNLKAAAVAEEALIDGNLKCGRRQQP